MVFQTKEIESQEDGLCVRNSLQLPNEQQRMNRGKPEG